MLTSFLSNSATFFLLFLFPSFFSSVSCHSSARNLPWLIFFHFSLISSPLVFFSILASLPSFFDLSRSEMQQSLVMLLFGQTVSSASARTVEHGLEVKWASPAALAPGCCGDRRWRRLEVARRRRIHGVWKSSTGSLAWHGSWLSGVDSD